MPTEAQAVSLLEELGLTEYEARCFVALSRVRKATAKEISELSEVPRSRVYDAVDRLHRRGLVDVQQSEPRRYQALPRDEAVETLRKQYQSTLDEAETALSKLQQSENLEESGAWAIAEHDHVTDRITTLIDDAESEVYMLVADGEVVDRSVCGRLDDAVDRGVDVVVETATDELAERISEHVPRETVKSTELAAGPSNVGEKWLGRIALIDRQSVLISALSETARPGVTEETAIWAKGPDHGLVVGLDHLLESRIDEIAGSD